jgi:hypothetical protein
MSAPVAEALSRATIHTSETKAKVYFPTWTDPSCIEGQPSSNPVSASTANDAFPTARLLTRIYPRAPSLPTVGRTN